ncbi:MAG: flagellar export chaperone FliS [Gammaproteobacteria bacterium]|nr:flagellar export chaperone FliS [Gammaproteobacteria bacterium]MBU1441520.1 flagellar export chaperone FliS [Gammaproteobacteria bacterium]MBU2288343.1 flagellar export chaperone FliS [Gammaproteobacteria bacterium]MBU2410249.1 flagellar export chaperone FliS [Gammaproteobacteria bacterium]
MYNAVNARAAHAYRRVSAETNVDGASPHQLIVLVFDGLRQALASAEVALLRGDLATKGAQIVRAVRFLEEGLKGGLDDVNGGDLAARLRALYDYCIARLTIANLHNDPKPVAEVASLIAPIAQSWQEIGRTSAGLQPA